MKLGFLVMNVGKKAGGPETYEAALLQNLAGIDCDNEYHLYCVRRGAAEALGIDQENFAVHRLWPPTQWVNLPVTFPLMLAKDGIPFFHAPFVPPPFSLRPYVFTHHCFSPFAHPEFYDPAVLARLKHLLVKGLKHARLVLCVSRNVLDLTAEHLGIPREKMRVVYNGVSRDFKPIDKETARAHVAECFNLREPYILFVGKLQRRKNITRILEAYGRLPKETRSGLQVALVGQRTWAADDLDETIARLGLQGRVVHIEYTDNRLLPHIYSAAELFAFPSLWEGFGIPLIEAMACGTPTFTSNLSCLPEVAGDASLIVDPYSVEEIAGAMERILSDEGLRKDLVAKGLERAKRFDWEFTARDTLKAYEEMASSV